MHLCLALAINFAGQNIHLNRESQFFADGSRNQLRLIKPAFAEALRMQGDGNEDRVWRRGYSVRTEGADDVFAKRLRDLLGSVIFVVMY